MVQIAVSFSLLVSKSSFPIIDIVIGFEKNAYQTELLVSNLNEKFRTALGTTVLRAEERYEFDRNNNVNMKEKDYSQINLVQSESSLEI